MGVGGQRHAPAALPPEMTRYPLYKRLGRPQGRSGRVLKISPPPEFGPRTVQLVASSYTDYAIPEMRTRNISCGLKAAGAYCWLPCYLHVPIVYKFWKPQPPAALRACSGQFTDCFNFTFYLYIPLWRKHKIMKTKRPSVTIMLCCSSHVI
jgi:hypothetical protein